MTEREALDHQSIAVGDEQLDQYKQGSHGPGIMRGVHLAASDESEYGAT